MSLSFIGLHTMDAQGSEPRRDHQYRFDIDMSSGIGALQQCSRRVTTRFARLASGQTVFGCAPTANPSAAAFTLCSAGDIAILSAASGGSPVASAVPAVVLSHGKNGYGAYSSLGIQQALPANADEAANSDGDGSFVGNPAVDDQLAWIPASVLMNRMLAAGRLP